MRLVRIDLAAINTTVGAVSANVEMALAIAKQASGVGATVVVFPEQTIGGYPQEDLVQWSSFLGAQWQGLHQFTDRTKNLSAILVIGVAVHHAASVYNCAAVVHRGKIHGLVPKEKLPTYDVFYEGRTLTAGRPGLRDDIDGVAFGDLLFRADFGRFAVEVCEDIWSPTGPMRRRSFAGAELILNLSASPFRVGMAKTRQELVCTRSWDNQVTLAYVGLLGANDGLIFDGGGYVAQNGRLLYAAPRFCEGHFPVIADLDRSKRLRVENTTFRLDRDNEVIPASLGQPVDLPDATGFQKLHFPPPPSGSFFLPAGGGKSNSERATFCEELLDALALGVGDYFEKTGAFQCIGVALSGGRDSLLCLLIAHRYVEKRLLPLAPEAKTKKQAELLRAFFMPSRYSSPGTRKAAEKTAEELGVLLAIEPIDDAMERETQAAQHMLQPGEALSSQTLQNIQARIRGARMWNWSNAGRGLFLQTSNMSEKAVGYTTIGGDMEGALSVIANVPKTVVNYLLDYLLETTNLECIRLTLAQPASAELQDDQQDERDLMPFAVLDACFALFAGEKMAPFEVTYALAAMFPETRVPQIEAWVDRFITLFQQSIYKWVQSPLALHVGNLDLDRERAMQLPVVQKTQFLTKPPRS